MSLEKSDLYFIAILPQEGLYETISDLKKHICEKYNSKAALNSPPHITLFMPFKWQKKNLERLENTLFKLASLHPKFDLNLKNFDAFKPRVIFIDVIESQPLRIIQKSLVKYFKLDLNLFDKGFEERPYHPHVTIAFRDLKKDMFKIAWEEEFASRSFEAVFHVHNISLLKHNGRSWEVFKNYPLIG